MATPRTIARVQALIWVLIYGGLLTLILGIATERADQAEGWPLVLGGGVAAAAGCVLIWVRSRMKADT